MAIRINKAIKELNIGFQVALDFLREKGYTDVEESIFTKLSDEQYQALVNEYGRGKGRNSEKLFSEKILKQKATSIESKRTDISPRESNRTNSDNPEKSKDKRTSCDVFISYSRYDKETIFPLVERINHELRINCWIDLKGIESGEEFEEVIMKAIEDCQIVLFMLSDSSLKSPWTKREVYYAEGESKRIVPILIDGDRLRGWFKFHFGNVDYIDINSCEQKEKLISNLKSWLNIPQDTSLSLRQL